MTTKDHFGVRSGMSIPEGQEPNHLLRAALEHAERGVPVFPCKPDKRPAIRKCWEAKKKNLTGEKLAAHARTCPRDGHGFHDATTDPEKIRKWWTKYPGALIGSPAERWFVLDVDVRPDGGIDGWAELAELECQNGKLPDTMRVRTPSGGGHIYLEDFEGVGNSRGSLPEGLDIRGGGKGYTILPPSPGYEVEHRAPIAQAPEWLRQMILTKPKAKVEAIRGDGESGKYVYTGGEVPYGDRNNGIHSYLCSRHDGRESFEELLGWAEEFNATHCEPPIGQHPTDTDPDEVPRIARSVYGMAPCKRVAPAPDQDTLDFLRAFEPLAAGDTWKGHRRGRQSLLKTYILHARRYGELVEDGVAISISNMQAAEANGVSDRAVRRNNQKLVDEGYIRHANDERKPLEAGTIILLSSALTTAPAHNVLTYPLRFASSTPLGHFARESEERPWTAPRARHSRGVYEGRERIGTIRRMGKSAEAAVDVLEHVGGRMQDTALAEVLGMRVRDLYRQNAWLERLVEAGVVEITEGYIGLTESWLEAWNDRREQDLEIEDFHRNVKRHNERREVYREGIEVRKLSRVMGDEEIAEALGIGIERVRRHLGRKHLLKRIEAQQADGCIEELEKIEPELELAGEDREALEAIEEFESRYGAGSFKWNQAGAKELFYQCDVWPDQDQLERITAYLDATDERRAA